MSNISRLCIVFRDFALVLEWNDGEWEKWESLQSSEELASVKNIAQVKLDRAKEMNAFKGKGKGPSGR